MKLKMIDQENKGENTRYQEWQNILLQIWQYWKYNNVSWETFYNKFDNFDKMTNSLHT